MFSVQCSVFSVQCSVFSAQCSVLSAQCSGVRSQCLVGRVWFTVRCEGAGLEVWFAVRHAGRRPETQSRSDGMLKPRVLTRGTVASPNPRVAERRQVNLHPSAKPHTYEFTSSSNTNFESKTILCFCNKDKYSSRNDCFWW